MPILGDLATVDFAKPSQGLAAEARRHDGIFEQRIFDFPVTVVTSVDLINDVNNEDRWEKNVGHSLRKLRALAGDGLFTAYNDEPNWSKAHNILTPAFSKALLTNYHASIAATVQEFTTGWDTHADNGTFVDIADNANKLTIEIIARAGFQYSFGDLTNNATSPFIEAVLRELHYANRRTDAIPLYERLFGGRRKQQHYDDKRFIRAEIDKIINSRRAAPRNDAEAPDMLDIMLNTVDSDTAESLDDNNIGNQILTFLVAGSETSANAIGFALHYLATRPDIAAQARAEIDRLWPDPDYPTIDFGDVSKLRYLRRVVDETLRLWPVAPGYFRQAKHDTSIGDGRYAFAAGEWVFVLLVAAHRDPAWGHDADEFNPDRFLADNLRSLPPRIYKPFGHGARSCIGRQFALHEMILTLAAILHRYDLEAEPGYELGASETLTLKPEGLRLRPTRRR